jgi:YgiT-type zinc finger domain-containing protein
MKCIICHGEDIRESDVVEEVRIGRDIVEIPVTTLVCKQCGERYYDPPTMRYLDKVEDDLKSGQFHLPETGRIYAYPQAKAA